MGGPGQCNDLALEEEWSGSLGVGGSSRSCPSADPRAPPQPPLSSVPPGWQNPAVVLAPSTCSYLACPPGIWGQWAWTVAPDQLNSRPAPETHNSSPAASQKSGGDRGKGGKSEHRGQQSPPFPKRWPWGSGNYLFVETKKGPGCPGGGNGLGAHGSPKFQFSVGLPFGTTMPVAPGTPPTQLKSSAFQQGNSLPSCTTVSPPPTIPERCLGIFFDTFFVSPTRPVTKFPFYFPNVS